MLDVRHPHQALVETMLLLFRRRSNVLVATVAARTMASGQEPSGGHLSADRYVQYRKDMLGGVAEWYPHKFHVTHEVGSISYQANSCKLAWQEGKSIPSYQAIAWQEGIDSLAGGDQS